MESILRFHHIIVKLERKAITKSFLCTSRAQVLEWPSPAALSGELGMHRWKCRRGVRSGRSSRASASPVTTAAGVPRSPASRAGSLAPRLPASRGVRRLGRVPRTTLARGVSEPPRMPEMQQHHERPLWSRAPARPATAGLAARRDFSDFPPTVLIRKPSAFFSVSFQMGN